MESITIKLHKGFTLIELLVVAAIILVITSVAITSQTSFNKQNLLTDTAYTVALSVRESQSLGISGRAFAGVPDAGYGVHFGDSPSYYDQFADIYPTTGVNSAYCSHPASNLNTPAARPGDCLYELADAEQVSRYTLTQGYTISNVCGIQSSGIERCSAAYPGATLDIVFQHPNVQATITGTFTQGFPIPLTEGVIHVTSPQGGDRCIVVTQLGEIYVTQTCP